MRKPCVHICDELDDKSMLLLRSEPELRRFFGAKRVSLVSLPLPTYVHVATNACIQYHIVVSSRGILHEIIMYPPLSILHFTRNIPVSHLQLLIAGTIETG